jgi:hypothetical protein
VVAVSFESYESLSEGLQNALWRLGGVPKYHRTDNLTCAVNKVGHPEVFTDNYRALASHYGFSSEKIQAGHPNENGDVEQRHHRLKRAVEQALMLRGSRDFAHRDEYEIFLGKIFAQLNTNRTKRFHEELKVLGPLPHRRLEDFRRYQCKVSQASTIRVLKNTYSVHSRLIGEKVKVRIYAEYLEVWYAQRKIEHLPRLRGENSHHINYRHIIDWLVRKPGAFEHYRYKKDLFPTSQFRISYDLLRAQHGVKQANKHYLKILELAARENEMSVNEALRLLIDQEKDITSDIVETIVESDREPPAITDIDIEDVDLSVYDQFLELEEVLV